MHEFDPYAPDVNGRMLSVVHKIWELRRLGGKVEKHLNVIRWAADDPQFGSFEASIQDSHLPQSQTAEHDYVIARANVRRNGSSITVKYLGFQVLNPIIQDDDQFAIYFLEGLQAAHTRLSQGRSESQTLTSDVI